MLNELLSTIHANVSLVCLCVFHSYEYEWTGIQDTASNITSIHLSIMQCQTVFSAPVF